MTIKAPSHLEPETRRWFEEVLSSYELESHHVRLLQLVAEAWDRTQQARRAVEELGLVYGDKYCSPKVRPEALIERDSRLAFAES